MTQLGTRAKIVAVVLAVIGIMAFGEMSAAALLAISAGTLLIILGLGIYYRPASVFGAVAVSIGAGIAVNLESLSEFSDLLIAAVGIFVPVYVLAWAALSSEQMEPRPLDLKGRAARVTIMYAAVCMASLPLAWVAIGLALPNIAINTTIITEAAIMLLVATVLFLIVSTRSPRPIIEEQSEEAPAAEEA